MVEGRSELVEFGFAGIIEFRRARGEGDALQVFFAIDQVGQQVEGGGYCFGDQVQEGIEYDATHFELGVVNVTANRHLHGDNAIGVSQ